MKIYFLLILILIPLALVFASPVTVKTQADYSFNSSSAEKLAKNKDRKGLVIVNKGPATAFVKFGSVHSGTEGIQLASGSLIDFQNAPMDGIYVAAATSAGTNTIGILEFE